MSIAFPLAHISHQPRAADANMLAVTECAPCGRINVVSTTPASTYPPMCLWHIGLCTPSQRHLDALATKPDEHCGLARLCRLGTLVMVLLATACSIPEPPANRYQSSAEVSQLEARPVAELHSQALAALDAEQYQQAIDYLQRAIKIQPRNAWSWHYLAQAYWREGQFDRCLAMIERSSSYANDDVVDGANDKLKAQCQHGMYSFNEIS